MGTLSKRELIDRLGGSGSDKLVVTPILDAELQVNEIGIDLRLSSQFIIFRIENINAIDPAQLRSDSERVKCIQTEVVVPFGTPFYLHPQEMVLGATFEYVAMPDTIEASVEGRSSLARVGLVIATAVTIEPGFKGCITLELANIASVPIALYPGTRIAQLVCRETTSSAQHTRGWKYLVPVGPEFSRLHSDKDGPFAYRTQPWASNI
ncbi:MAG: Deoxycytidine triphosphate deaminase [Chloroflexi bacterium ADurb.Bin180]|nr:MAG: Deoxycytidine triphosphate deaminase [Chloroflexi bacterium ADurb.Bin180]